MALPIVPGSEVSTPAAAVPIDAGPLRGAALAQGRVGQAIGEGVASVFGEVSEKIQANRNARTVFDADLAMRTAKDNFTAQLHQMPDEGKWLPAWKEQTANLREQILSGPNVGPDVKRMLTAKLDNWQQATSTEVRTAALLKGTRETHDSAVAASTMAYSQGDIEGGDNILKAAQSHYAMDESEVKTRIAQGEQVASEATAANIIANDPIHAPDLIKPLEPHMKNLRWKSTVRSAFEAQSQARTRNYNELSEMIDLSPDHSIDPDLLRQKVKDGEILQSHMNSLLTRVKTIADVKVTAQKKTETEAFNVTMSEAQEHDWVSDVTPEKTKESLKAEGLEWTNPALRRRLNSYIDAQFTKAKKQGETEEKPVEKQIFDQMREDRTANGFTIPVALQAKPGALKLWDSMMSLGAKREPGTTAKIPAAPNLSDLRDPDKVSDAQITALFGEGMTREKLIRAEQQHYATIQGKMRDWFKDPANKAATYEQANDYRIKLEQPFVMQAVAKSLDPTGATSYKTTKEVQAAFHAGTLKRAEAEKILKEQFGLK